MKRKFYIYKNGNYYEDSTPGLVDVTYAQIKTLRDGGNLTPGAFYRITDYQCTTAQENTSSANHQFDIIVLALENNKLSEEAWAAHHAGDTYFANSKLEAWRIWYCLDNDATRFGWAMTVAPESMTFFYWPASGRVTAYRDDQYDDPTRGLCFSFNLNDQLFGLFVDSLPSPSMFMVYSYSGGQWSYQEQVYGAEYHPASTTEGKGVVYRMIDEFNNDVPYDFKNILLTSSDKYTNAYTFSYTENSTIKDASLLGQSKGCYSNVMKGPISSISFNVFYSTDTLFSCYSNTFGESCSSNTFGNGCHSNTFGQSFSSNTFGNDCAYNSFGDNCSGATFGESCTNNTFGNSCNCTFGQFCSFNTFAGDCMVNTFGADCSYITFGTSSSTIDNCRRIILDGGCRSLYINSDDTSGYLQNVHIHAGVRGASSRSRRTITVPDRNLAYSTDYYANGSQTVILD